MLQMITKIINTYIVSNVTKMNTTYFFTGSRLERKSHTVGTVNYKGQSTPQ